MKSQNTYPMIDPIEIIVAEDKPKFRTIMKEMLKPFNISVIAEAENGQELLSLLEEKKADIVFIDLEMPVMNGNEAFKKICEKFPGTKVIILSFYNEAVLIENYLERGAKGYICKDAIEENLLVNAIRKVKSGGIFVSDVAENKKKFSSRQIEMMPLIFDGNTNEQIAKEIGISKRAVEKQKQRLYKNIGLDKPMDFYIYCFSKGLQFLSRVYKGSPKNS